MSAVEATRQSSAMGMALFAVIVAVFASSVGMTAAPDKRLSSIKKAFIVPVDDLGDDRPVAACMADRLSQMTPIAAVQTREDADAVFRVSAHLPSATARVMMGTMGGSPSAHLFVELGDGTKLWDDGAKLRRTVGGRLGRLETSDGAKGVECGLADELLDTLRVAMRHARDHK